MVQMDRVMGKKEIKTKKKRSMSVRCQLELAKERKNLKGLMQLINYQVVSEIFKIDMFLIEIYSVY